MNTRFFVSVAHALEPVLADELSALGLLGVRAVSAGVQFDGGLADAYRVCLWSRVANRVLLPITAGKATSPEQLYRLVQTIDWSGHLHATGTLAVDFYCSGSEITHSHYGALKVKDAIVDQFRTATGVRPSVDRIQPDVRVNVYLYRDRARVAIDLSGSSLHRRGYRRDGAAAPLKETLAAALLYTAGWPRLAASGGRFHDPMCGSGTLLIEAAMMAADRAPGLDRDYFGFIGWLGHDPALWLSLLDEARRRAEIGHVQMPALGGSDRSTVAVGAARANLQQAGFSDRVRVVAADITQVLPPGPGPGLVMLNPPYGLRLDDKTAVGALYGAIGEALRKHWSGWQVALFTGAGGVVHRTRLGLQPVLKVDNGGVPCRLYVTAEPLDGRRVTSTDTADESVATPSPDVSVSPRSAASVWPSSPVFDDMFANRVRRNLRVLRRWRMQQGINAFRVYDADMPEYAVAVDVYDVSPVTGPETLQRHVVVQEYQAPKSVPEARAADRLQRVLATLPEVLECEPSRLHLKVRQRQRGEQQYQPTGAQSEDYLLLEDGCRLLVNLDAYLDTGIFLDHRKVRQFIQNVAAGRRFLNLFSYTGAATVHAARGGARASLSLDLSNTYLEWSARNLAENGVSESLHRLQRADCLDWLEQPAQTEPFDLILFDPPTFSNSARMTGDWDVQRDHARAIRQVMQRLSPSGLLIFSNNNRRFRLAEELLREFTVEDRIDWSLDRDFQRNRRIHNCWFFRHRSAAAEDQSLGGWD